MIRIERRLAVPGAESWDWPVGLHPVLRRVLARRPIASPAELELKLKHLVPVGRFGALARAVELLTAHRDDRIVIVGDFDADGATSAALGVLTLRDLGFADVRFFIPDRFALGYGLSPEAVDPVAAQEPRLLVTVDNGISSVAGVAAARARGIDVLVTDHHLPPAVLPDANAIVNPNLPDSDFPGKQLAGVGVLFYVLAALGKAVGSPTAVSQYLDLVALGTVADLVRLDRLNRILVAEGIARIRAGACRPGVRALCEVAGVAAREATAETLGFHVAPRLNAAGRLDDMTIGVRCLLAESDAEAARLAATLHDLNRDRRALEARMQEEALALLESTELDQATLPSLICLSAPNWHEGLVGLIASRIKDRYHRPTFAFAPAEGGMLKGSGRSIAGFHLRDALADVDVRHPGLIVRYGGHAMAAGLTLPAAGLERLRHALEEVAAEKLEADALAARALTDGELLPEEMTLTVARALRDFGPWGQGFPEPSFDGRFELVDRRLLKDAHLKMTLRPLASDAKIEAIAFNRGDTDWPAGTELHCVYRLAINDYRATSRVQLVVSHVDAVS
ncbi:MAG TPA: single-stranded-DNA-specific exonuclease RecJ [Gammaproteobacteria bacterium]